MANKNPYKARVAKKRAKKSIGNLTDARTVLWSAILKAESVLNGEEVNPTMVLRAVHALTQACSAYSKIVEVGELEQRMCAIELHYGIE